MSRPPDIRIEDLGEPQLAPEVVAQIEASKPLADALPFHVEGVCGAAMAETGLDDFGAEDFRERLALLLRGFEQDGGYTPLGCLSAFGYVQRLARNRLRLEDLYKRHPEINEVEVAPPIVIAGLPRTGTTHLHNLISADPNISSLPYWEALEPFPAVGDEPGPGEPDPRLARCAQTLAGQDVVMPHFKRMHEMTVEHVHEEIDLYAMDFSGMTFETIARSPGWLEWYKASDQTPHYRYLRKALAALQWLRGGGDRWVLKTAQHLEQLGPLLKVFPGATVVMTHRDPVSIVASLGTMIAYGARLTEEKVDPPAIAAWWKGRTLDQLSACIEDAHKVPAAQSVHVHFDRFMADDVAAVKRIYEVAGQPMPSTSVDAIRAYMREHPRGRHGRVLYDLADFDLSNAVLREEFRFYTEHFDVTLES